MLLEHDVPIACGIYPKKGLRSLSCHVLPGTEELVFGREGGLTEIQYARHRVSARAKDGLRSDSRET